MPNRAKCLLYDPSIRVPLIIQDPRLAGDSQGQRPRTLVLSLDVGPTILELCGSPVPASMQGRSLRPLLRGEHVEWRRDFFCESLILLQDYPVIQGGRNADWKYLRYWPNRKTPRDYRQLLNLGLQGEQPAYEELFHLTADPAELRNLAAEPAHQKLLAAMRLRSVELLRDARGNPQALPTVPRSQWLSEAPPAWKDLIRKTAKGSFKVD